MNDDATVHRPKRGGGRAYHSRLEPFVDFIREQRQRRRTWKEIAESLRCEKGCAVTLQGVHQFYRRFVLQSRKPHWETQAPPTPANGRPEIRAGVNATGAPLPPSGC